MPYSESVKELAKAIAEMAGVKGQMLCECGGRENDNVNNHGVGELDCSCERCFKFQMAERIKEAVINEIKLGREI